MHEPQDAPSSSPSAWPAGGGESGALIRSTDWSTTPLGPPSGWPRSLRTMVNVMLHARHPMFLWWGPELIQFYNDGYLPSFGQGKHPGAMGQQGRDCWGEIWPIIWPQIDDVMSRAKASWNEDQLVPIFRNGRIEEVFWTYGYSPVFDDEGHVGGTLVVCTETTPRVLAERRLHMMKTLSQRTLSAPDVPTLLEAAARVFDTTPNDLPCALFYACGPDADAPILTAISGVDTAHLARADDFFRLRLAAWCAQPEQRAEGWLLVNGLEHLELQGRPWSELIGSACIVALGSATGCDYLVYGLSPRLPFDTGYLSFLAQVTDQLSLAQNRVLAQRRQHRDPQEREALLHELETASRAKDEFLALLGHELRNPLSPIVTALELMKLQPANTTRAQQVIERQVKHLVRLVDDLLDVSKITRGKVELQKEVLELAEVVAKAVEIASHLFEQRAQRLSLQVPIHGLLVEADPVRLAQVIANLLTNASRYTAPQGHIELSAEREGAFVVITVQDDGQGIAAEFLPHIFDAFTQGKRSADRAEGGLGIGLTLVRSLVELHGGTVSVISAGLNQGSQFTVRLPVSTPARKATASSPASASPEHGAPERRVLLVDDNRDAAETLRVALEARGHVVCVANDPVAALELVVSFQADVAVLDIGLPVMDGYELAARIQSLTPNCRLIALTGYGQQRDHDKSLNAGFTAHFVKPVPFGRLLAAIDGDQNRTEV